jgi:hypothetical protein
VELVSFLGVRLKKSANVPRVATDPPFAGSIDAHVIQTALRENGQMRPATAPISDQRYRQ